jgi:phage repressor protein C with HTH and peptisase S24 domain
VVDLATVSEVFCRASLQNLRTVQEENSEILSDFALRLSQAATRAGLTQAEIAARLGISDDRSGRVNNWFKARNFPRAREKPLLAKLLGVRPEWLYHGLGEPQEYSGDPAVNEAQAEYGTKVREVPLISWTHAGVAASYEAMPKHWHGRVPSTSRDPRAFALTIEGDSMEPKFFAGDRVICEPSEAPRNGRPVVAKYENEEVQLRIYHKLPDGKIRLSSLRPEIYPTMEYNQEGFRWIFPVKELVRSV